MVRRGALLVQLSRNERRSFPNRRQIGHNVSRGVAVARQPPIEDVVLAECEHGVLLRRRQGVPQVAQIHCRSHCTTTNHIHTTTDGQTSPKSEN